MRRVDGRSLRQRIPGQTLAQDLLDGLDDRPCEGNQTRGAVRGGIGHLAQEQPCHRRALVQEVDPTRNRILCALHQGVWAAQDRFDARQQVAQQFAEYGLVEFVLVAVVVDDRSATDADALGHIFEAGRREAEVGEDIFGGIQDRTPGLLAALGVRGLRALGDRD